MFEFPVAIGFASKLVFASLLFDCEWFRDVSSDFKGFPNLLEYVYDCYFALGARRRTPHAPHLKLVDELVELFQ